MRKEDVIERLEAVADADNALVLSRFFKTGEGEYGFGDKFIGVTVPKTRKVARECYDKVDYAQISELVASPIHEHRLVALFMLVERYRKAKKDKDERSRIVDFYLNSLDGVNNWDLVDLSAPKILGEYLCDGNNDRKVLYDLSESGSLWRQRVAIVSCYTLIKNDDFEDILLLSARHIAHPHDLINKAVGWMLREVGKRNEDLLVSFLSDHYSEMSRTTLRYAIERFEPARRAKFLKGDFS